MALASIPGLVGFHWTNTSWPRDADARHYGYWPGYAPSFTGFSDPLFVMHGNLWEDQAIEVAGQDFGPITSDEAKEVTNQRASLEFWFRRQWHACTTRVQYDPHVFQP